jgi:hypothetical protein
MTNYLSIPLLAIVLTAYLVSLGLVKKGKITLLNQRRFWNIILLVSFVIAASLGILMAVLIDLNIPILIYRNIISLHVKAGVVMAVVAVFHGLWHLPYYLALLRKRKS